MSTPQVWFTGFEPFGGFSRNPSIEYAIAAAQTARQAGVASDYAVLAVTYDRAARWSAQRIDGLEPAPLLVVHFGLASGLSRPRLRLELQARNMRGPNPDNAGRSSDDLGPRLQDEGPDYLRTDLDLVAIGRDLERSGRIEPILSFSAGTYVCNAVYYASLQAALSRPQMDILFVHVPWSEPGEPWARDCAQVVASTVIARWRP